MSAESTTRHNTSTSHVLAIDVGNTRAKIGLFADSPSNTPHPLVIEASLLSQTPSLPDCLLHTIEKWTRQLKITTPSTAMVAGSEADLRDELVANWPVPNCSPTVITGHHQLPIATDVEFPEKVGIDRLLDAFAAWTLAGRCCDIITVDSGTATTVDLMSAAGIFRGGSILPGLRLSAIAMHEYTARLPLIDTDCELEGIPEVPGRNTLDAMRAGLFIGQLGAVRELIQRLTDACHTFHHNTSNTPRQSTPATEDRRTCGVSIPQRNEVTDHSIDTSVSGGNTPRVYVTGGGGRLLVRHLPQTYFVDSLALHGLAMLAHA